MFSTRSLSWLRPSAVAALVLVAFAGCYGSTEPATELGPENAKLNARGTANNGPATSWFQYWVTGPNPVKTTTTRHWPAGASGPFSERITGLYASTSYSFRVCGKDDSGGATACAQTRTFRTQPTIHDSVVGSWALSPHFEGSVDAHSPAPGSLGTIRARDGFSTFTGGVTCLLLNGNRAAVGAVGSAIDDPTAKETLLAAIVDGGPAAPDAVKVGIQPGTTPPDCSSVTFGDLRIIDGTGDLVINNP
jgi:hypothetical protein